VNDPCFLASWPRAVGAILCLAACGKPAGAPAPIEPAYAYSVAPPPEGSWMLQVEATFERAPSDRLVAPEAGTALRDVELVDRASTTPVAHIGDAWVAATCRARCVLRYVVDLEALASSCRGMGCTRRVGGAVIGTASTWMLRPEPAGEGSIVVRLSAGDPTRFATGLRRDPRGGFVLRTSQLGETSYTAFGSFRRSRINAPGAAFDVALLGAPLAMGDAATLGWIQDSAVCVSRLYGRFPVDPTVFVVPVPGADRVVFGRVMSLAGASVALYFGDQARPESAHSEWVVVHELFHLTCPSFVGEGQWLEEGLATYYEPILRTRAGWMTETELWSHFAREMPRGLRGPGAPPALEERDDIDSTYWGGALFVLLADVGVLEHTHGARSLDDVLRAALSRLGDATHAARVDDWIRTGDEATGTGVLQAVKDTWAVRGENPDLVGLWRRLGVDVHDGNVTLRNDAPLAAVRRRIATGEGY
jgi:hypothetical protein